MPQELKERLEDLISPDDIMRVRNAWCIIFGFVLLMILFISLYRAEYFDAGFWGVVALIFFAFGLVGKRRLKNVIRLKVMWFDLEASNGHNLWASMVVGTDERGQIRLDCVRRSLPIRLGGFSDNGCDMVSVSGSLNELDVCIFLDKNRFKEVEALF